MVPLSNQSPLLWLLSHNLQDLCIIILALSLFSQSLSHRIIFDFFHCLLFLRLNSLFLSLIAVLPHIHMSYNTLRLFHFNFSLML